MEEIILPTMSNVSVDILVYAPKEFEIIKDRLFVEYEIRFFSMFHLYNIR